MKLSTAVVLRLNNLLQEKNMSNYALRKEIAMSRNTMNTLMSERNGGVNLRTVMQIARGLNMTVAEFLNDPLFESPELDID